MKKIKTGIYGGSFNPIHNGHIAIARKMIELAGLDEVWLMVSPQNPLKHSVDLLDEQLRLDMTRIALEPYPQLKACDYEFHLPRPSYMWHTLQSLTHDYPKREFTLLIAADNWAVLPLVSCRRHHCPLSYRHLSTYGIPHRYSQTATNSQNF